MREEEYKQIARLMREEKYQAARRLLLKELEKDPHDPYILAELSGTFYEQHQYRKARDYAMQAHSLAPWDPLYRWYYAAALSMLGQTQEAIALYKSILKMGVNRVGFVATTEGIRWAKSLLNDCRYSIALCYKDMGNLSLARRYLRNHLNKRARGIPSLHKRKDVERRLQQLEKEKQNRHPGS